MFRKTGDYKVQRQFFRNIRYKAKKRTVPYNDPPVIRIKLYYRSKDIFSLSVEKISFIRHWKRRRSLQSLRAVT